MFALLCVGWGAGASAWQPTLAASPNAAAAGAAVSAFTVEDLVRLDRPSEVAASPDGRHVAFTLRTTDMAANRGRTAIWLIDPRKRNPVPARFTDLAANSNSAEWSADGKVLFYLSNRSGSMQVWRREVRADDGPTAEPLQVTHLPLDVGSFRVAAAADRIVFSLEVYIDCPDLECTQTRAAAPAAAAAHGILYDKLFVRHWDAWSDGRRSQLFSLPLDASGVASGTPVKLTVGHRRRRPEQTLRRPRGLCHQPGRAPRGLLRAGRQRRRALVHQFRHLSGRRRGRDAAQSHRRRIPAWDASPPFLRTARSSPTWPRTARASNRTVCISCCSTCKSGAARPLTQGWDRSIAAFAWSPDGRTLFATADHLGPAAVVGDRCGHRANLRDHR